MLVNFLRVLYSRSVYRTQKSGACAVAGESKSRMANSICARGRVVGSLNYVIPLLRVQCLTDLVQRYVQMSCLLTINYRQHKSYRGK